MKLSQLSPKQKTRLLAELDGFYNVAIQIYTSNRTRPFETESGWFGNVKPFDERQTFLVPNYLTSCDAIIPLVQKLYPTFNDRQKDTFMRQFMTVDNYMMATPSQLCDAVLIATGKAEL